MNKHTKELASKGRFGDSILAHINPSEALLLKLAGGAGTINPDTGLIEFYNTTGNNWAANPLVSNYGNWISPLVPGATPLTNKQGQKVWSNGNLVYNQMSPENMTTLMSANKGPVVLNEGGSYWKYTPDGKGGYTKVDTLPKGDFWKGLLKAGLGTASLWGAGLGLGAIGEAASAGGGILGATAAEEVGGLTAEQIAQQVGAEAGAETTAGIMGGTPVAGGGLSEIYNLTGASPVSPADAVSGGRTGMEAGSTILNSENLGADLLPPGSAPGANISEGGAMLNGAGAPAPGWLANMSDPNKLGLGLTLAGLGSSYFTGKANADIAEGNRKALAAAIERESWTDANRGAVGRAIDAENANSIAAFLKRTGGRAADSGRGGGFYGNEAERAREAGRESKANFLSSTFAPNTNLIPYLAQAGGSSPSATDAMVAGVGQTSGNILPYLLAMKYLK